MSSGGISLEEEVGRIVTSSMGRKITKPMTTVTMKTLK